MALFPPCASASRFAHRPRRDAQVAKRDKALRRAEGDMRAVEEERDALRLQLQGAEGQRVVFGQTLTGR
jgi:hypothetical protein